MKQNRSAFLKTIESNLSEARMGFLALVAFGAGLAQVVFDTTPKTDLILESLEWSIIAIFALDYVVTLLLSENWREYALSAWGLLDLAIVVCPLFSLLPGVGDAARSTTIFRLLRLARAAVFGARAGWAATRAEEQAVLAVESAAFGVTLVSDDETTPKRSSLGAAVSGFGGSRAAWWHFAGGTAAELNELALATRVPVSVLNSVVTDDNNYPRVFSPGGLSALFSWIPSVRNDSGRLVVDRQGVLLLTNGKTIFTVAKSETQLQEVTNDVVARYRLEDVPFAGRAAGTILSVVVERNEQVSGELERALRALDAMPIQDSSPEFFARAFWIKRELSAAKADLWRFKGMAGALAEGRTQLPGLQEAPKTFLKELSQDAEYLHGTVEQMQESVISIIELHLNIVSFGMNQFMRLLAVVSALGLIPAVVGGMLGMNVAGNPWEVTLSQVAFGVGMGMLTCLYFFLVRGWLR